MNAARVNSDLCSAARELKHDSARAPAPVHCRDDSSTTRLHWLTGEEGEYWDLQTCSFQRGARRLEGNEIQESRGTTTMRWNPLYRNALMNEPSFPCSASCEKIRNIAKTYTKFRHKVCFRSSCELESTVWVYNLTATAFNMFYYRDREKNKFAGSLILHSASRDEQHI